MADYPELFYAPINSTPVPIVGNKWRHPVTGAQIYNPQPDLTLDMLPLEFYVPEPRDDIQNNTPDYARNTGGTAINMSWTSELIAANVLYRNRLEELRELSSSYLVFNRDLGGEPADPEWFATTVLVHLARINEGDFDAQDEYAFLRDDGEWVQRSATQVSNFAKRLSKDVNDISDNYEYHKAELKTLRDAEDRIGLVEYDITTGWPAP